MSGARIIRLALALELGRLPAIGDVLGVVPYGSNPRLSEPAKRQRKAGLVTLHGILESKEGSRIQKLSSFFTNLIRDYSEAGCVQEASLLTQLWTEAQAFGRDEDTICEYLVEYLRKWAGRGIPVPVDVLLAQRVSGNRLQWFLTKRGHCMAIDD